MAAAKVSATATAEVAATAAASEVTTATTKAFAASTAYMPGELSALRTSGAFNTPAIRAVKTGEGIFTRPGLHALAAEFTVFPRSAAAHGCSTRTAAAFTGSAMSKGCSTRATATFTGYGTVRCGLRTAETVTSLSDIAHSASESLTRGALAG